MAADPETLTEPERRIALLDWLARGRDVRIAAELCGEKHDWAKDVAKAAGHPDRDQIRHALAAIKAELRPPRQMLKPDSIAPTRPVARPMPVHDMTVEQIVELIGTEDGGDADLPEHTEDMDGVLDDEQPAAERPSIVAEANANDWPPPGHIHEPRLVLEGRVWHALCPACGTTWHRSPCTAPGCGAYVSAEYVARTGSTRHDWHPKDPS